MKSKSIFQVLFICALTLAIALVGFAPVAADLFGRGDQDEPTPTPDPWAQERDNRLSPATATPSALSPSPTPYGFPMTVVGALARHKDLLMFGNLLTDGGLLQDLQGEGPFTLFAPTNEAFNKMESGKIEEMRLPDNRYKMDSLLRYHIVQGKYLFSDLKSTPTLQALNGDILNINQTSTTLNINEAAITGPDIIVSNGVIHKIDAVLIPPQRVPETPADMQEQPQEMTEPEPVNFPVPN